MDGQQLTNALTQTLENYRRCGLTRIAAPETSVLSAAQLEAVSQLVTPATPQASREKAIRSNTPASSASASAAKGARTASPPAVNPPTRVAVTAAADGIASAPWSLPVLKLDERLEKFEAMTSEARDCRKCSGIVDFRQQAVFGDGCLQPTICFVGEAPGADEDRQGKPFVGRAGQLLTKIIKAMKLERDQVYILNALKCRPPQNRTPVPDEIGHCRHFAESQLDTLQPKYIVCLGAVSVRCILQSEMPIGRLRGRFHSYRGARVVVTYHPSYLLRNESAKRHVWDDMKMLMADMGS